MENHPKSIEEQVMQVVAKAGSFETRICERDEGDIEFIQHGVPHGLSIDESNFITILHQLKSKGELMSSEQVHPGDTNEYIVSWFLEDPSKK